MAKIDKVQEVAVTLLKPYEKNAKIHGREQLDKLKASIEEFGFLTPCLIDSDYNIIAGHGRVSAAAEMGMKKVPCVFIEGLTENQRKAYILADNRLGELGEWDMDLVAQELRALEESGFEIDVTGFITDDSIFDLDPIDDNGIGQEIDDFLTEKPITNEGELWRLGRHRLLIGDSTNQDDVFKLAGGAVMDLFETDPPYNVNVSNAQGDTIKNDNIGEEEFYSFLCDAFSNAAEVMGKGASFYIWHADSNGLAFRAACAEAGLTIKQNLIWIKSHFTLGRQDYQWMHEPCLYGWKEGAGHYFSEKRNIPTVIKSVDKLEEMSREELIGFIEDLRKMTTVMHENTPMVDDLHPTMKPIELIKKQIKNSSKQGANVLDLFGGSGTTLLACEELNRNCFMMEYDPKYADVIINRWEEMTGEKAVQENV